ncbi:hypothetical protein [Roseospira visakhapatnamensis]|uniref:Solute-binding protein family 3/N-terminal domain-containing protein n=1 Tax=Roseospira visakhapatnamensis TaxID=390880 RepID=A0A7W6RFA5_9PROT|nr:hypothetical protein [Roseospira visakhapatnamensis]MBB4267252.1 hypothetical protein [Roseospira visakhapatnamensis]
MGAGLLATGLVVSSALAETPDAAPEGTEAAARPLVLCTAPWPPFVETVPPPLPPSARPDPRALGFTRPTVDEVPDAAEGSGDDDTGPPSRSETPDAGIVAAGAESVDEPASSTPLTGADVAPPVPPVTKSLGRVLAARDQPDPAAPETRLSVVRVPEVESPAAEPPATESPTIPLAAPLAAPPRPGVLLDRLSMPTARALLPHGRPGGPVTEAVVAACREAGLPCRISLLPWLRPAELLASGRCDGVFPVPSPDQTDRTMRISRSLVESRLAFFTLDTHLTEAAQFTDFIVLARGPSSEARHAHRAVEGLDQTRLVFGPDLPRLIARLGTLRPDDRVALFGNYHVITRAMAEVDGSVPALSVVPAGVQRLHVGFARDRVPAPVVRAFDQGLRRITETRELQEIMDLGDLESGR